MSYHGAMDPQDEHNARLLANVRPGGWRNPTPASRYNLVVIGAGTAGIVAATGAGILGARVAIIERGLPGGDCLNTGCVPSKSLIRSATVAHTVQDAERYGVQVSGSEVNFASVMERVRSVRATISHHDSVSHFHKYNIDLFFGDAQFVSADAVQVDGQTLRFKKAIIATGARPAHPPIEGLEAAGFLTNESIFELTKRPDRLAVIGGGPIGCEMAQAFQRLGSEVILIERAARILPRDDSDAADIVQQIFLREGMRLLFNTTITQVTTQQKRKVIHYQRNGEAYHLEVDNILVATGRSPNVEGLNLDVAGVRYDDRSGVVVNDLLQTSNNDIYAAGDVCLPYKFTHAADASARVALQNALFLGRERASALLIPWCTFTDPEVAQVGLHEHEAERRGLDVATFTVDMSSIDRAITDGNTEGFVKVLVKSGTDQVVGATIVGHNAGELISHVSMVIAGGIGLKKLSEVVYPYPVLSEAIHKIADAYNLNRVTAPVKGLSSMWLELTG